VSESNKVAEVATRDAELADRVEATCYRLDCGGYEPPDLLSDLLSDVVAILRARGAK